MNIIIVGYFNIAFGRNSLETNYMLMKVIGRHFEMVKYTKFKLKLSNSTVYIL